MATSTSSGEDKENTKFECNICFDTATDAVVSMCGHLFCWPCIHRWMEARPDSPSCPVCKSVIDKERLIPLYGRGSDTQEDPREKVPPRPQGQREDVPQTQNQGFFGETGGVNISFGVGTFPFGFGLGPTITYQTGSRRHQQQHPRGNIPPAQEDQRRLMARFMLTLAILFIIMIIIS